MAIDDSGGGALVVGISRSERNTIVIWVNDRCYELIPFLVIASIVNVATLVVMMKQKQVQRTIWRPFAEASIRLANAQSVQTMCERMLNTSNN